MTEQEVFDQVVAHLRKQGYKQAVDQSGHTCQYRGENGLKCAVGALIPDELYDPNLEGEDARHVCIQLRNTGWPYLKHVKLLMALQEVHDTAMSPRNINRHVTSAEVETEDAFKHVAGASGLVYTPPPALTECTTQGVPA